MSSRSAAFALVCCLLLSGCTLLSDEGESDDRPVAVDPRRSMTAAGERLAGSRLDDAPRYDVVADLRPGAGRVRGTVVAELPVGTDARQARMRYFAGVPDFGIDAGLGEVQVDGEPVRARRDGSIVRIPLPDGHDGRVEVTVPFHYVIPPADTGGSILDQLGGMGGPADVGLLARHEDAVNLGHWFPLWIPVGSSADPDPDGFGDIGNFPAAVIRAELTAPEGWTVADGGVRVEEEEGEDGRRTVVTEGYGMNDLVVSLLRGYVSRSRDLGGDLAGLRVTAYAPRRDRAVLDAVLDETAVAVRTLSQAWAPYPWRELDVISAPLGSGVGGMEWPGATWIEAELFAGGVPGLGGLADSLGGLGDLLGNGGGPDDLGGLLGGETGRLLETLRAWTIAHEVGHEWWHVVVGNDSVLDPVVDEPLAQHSACLVVRQSHPADADALCSGHVDSAYEQMRLLGDADAPAARPTDAFETSGQYAGVVYGKAAAFYRALEDAFGRMAVEQALATVVRDHAFAMVDADELRDSLAQALDGGPRFDRLWTRWMQQEHGDEDLAVDPDAGLGALLGGAEGIEGLEGLLGGGSGGGDLGQLEDLFAQLLDGLEPSSS